MKVLVCGGRDYNDYDQVVSVLNDVKGITLIIQGDARGADTLGKRYGLDNGIPVDCYPALWNQYGKRAGYLRNQQMLDDGQPDLVVAFPGGRGTAMMIRIAEEQGFDVTVIE
jgi:hypothetical protein